MNQFVKRFCLTAMMICGFIVGSILLIFVWLCENPIMWVIIALICMMAISISGSNELNKKVDSYITANCSSKVKSDHQTIIFVCDNGKEYTRDELSTRIAHGE